MLSSQISKGELLFIIFLSKVLYPLWHFLPPVDTLLLV